MDKLQLRFFEFASEVFQHAAPYVENPELEGVARELVMASSRMGAPFYRKHFREFTDQEFDQHFSSARMDMHDALLYLHMLIDKCPNNRELKLVEMKAKGFMAFLGGKVDENIAVQEW